MRSSTESTATAEAERGDLRKSPIWPNSSPSCRNDEHSRGLGAQDGLLHGDGGDPRREPERAGEEQEYDGAERHTHDTEITTDRPRFAFRSRGAREGVRQARALEPQL